MENGTQLIIGKKYWTISGVGTPVSFTPTSKNQNKDDVWLDGLLPRHIKDIHEYKHCFVEQLKPNIFFMFPNGRKRMVVESVKVGIAWTTVTATSPTGRTIKRDIPNNTLIFIY